MKNLEIFGLNIGDKPIKLTDNITIEAADDGVFFVYVSANADANKIDADKILADKNIKDASCLSLKYGENEKIFVYKKTFYTWKNFYKSVNFWIGLTALNIVNTIVFALIN